MATTTTNFGFDVPTSSDLVKNGATAISTLGQDIDTFLAGSPTRTAGKNKIINGDFYWNQRNFTSTTTNGTFGFDRWGFNCNGGTVTYSSQTFTTGTAPVDGYEGKTFARVLTSGQSGASDLALLYQSIESVRTFANQIITISFWAKAASGTPKIAVETIQNFGTGGSPSAEVGAYQGQATLSTSWARYTITTTIASISGKTIGTNNNDKLVVLLWTSAGSTFNSRTGSLGVQNNTIDIWGVQVEAGSTATPFQTATGTIQGELAACQRYYYRNTAPLIRGNLSLFGMSTSSTDGFVPINFPVSMRVTPTAVDYANIELCDTGSVFTVSALTLNSNSSTPSIAMLNGATTSMTSLRPVYARASAANGYIGLTAEL